MKITQEEIQVMESQISPLIEEADSYVVNSVETVEVASSFLKRVRDAEKVIEEKRLEFTKPINQSLKAINETFKRLAEPLIQARTLVTGKILSWRRAEAERIAKEEERRRKIQQSHKEAGHKVSAPVIMERPEKKIGNVQSRKVWTFKVKDFSKVPDEFKNINQVAVNLAIRDGARSIEGLEIYQEEKLSIV